MSVIIRRIDDLGRIVIPKEIRRELRIREGDPLEINVDSEKSAIMLTLYMPMAGAFASYTRDMLTSLRKTCPSFDIQAYDAAGDFTNMLSHLPMKQDAHEKLFLLAQESREKRKVALSFDSLMAAVPIICNGDFFGVITIRNHTEISMAEASEEVHQREFAEAVAAAKVMADFFSKFCSNF